MHRRKTAQFALMALMVLTAALGLRCGDNAENPMLGPTSTSTTGAAAQGTVSGVLDWGEDSPWPETIVYALLNYDPSCAGSINSVHITGTYNAWDTSTWESEPGMEEILPCYWVEEVEVEGDEDFAWKFVTNAAWDGSYADCAACDIDEEAMRGTVKGENGDDIQIPIVKDGSYWFLLNASVDPAPFQVATLEQLPWVTVGGETDSFSIENLVEGIYTLVIEAQENQDQFPRRVVKGVRVSGEEGFNLGIVEVVPTGFIAGRVEFSDSPVPRPAFDVRVLFAESGAVADSLAYAAADTVFEITGLNESRYDIVVHAAGYVDTTIENLAFEPGDDIELGTITLRRAGSASGIVVFADSPDSGPTVTVSATYPDSTATLSSAQTDQAGNFLLADLPPGLIDIHFEASKYRDTTLADVTITAGADTDLGTVPMQPGCVSVASTIHILGNFNGWDETLWTIDPGMRQTESCVWRDTVVVYPVFALSSEIKFAVDGAWGNDYARCPDELGDTLFGPVCLGADANLPLIGEGKGGRYEFILDEDSLQFRAKLIDEFMGGFRGSIAFDTGLEPPYPTVTIEVRQAGEIFLLASGTADVDDGSFELSGLNDGSFDVLFSGGSFLDSTITSSVSGGLLTDLGEVVLTEVEFQSEFTVIRVVGDFNGWNTTGPGMNQVSPGIWVDTIAVGESNLCPFMKFRTGEDWGENDYWNCGAEVQACTTPLSGDVCHGTGTGGNPPAIGHLNFETAGDYEFRLDEINLTYEITLIE